MKELDYKILNMNRYKLDTAIEWTVAVWWNPGSNKPVTELLVIIL